MAKTKLKRIKRMDNNCQIPEMAHAFSYLKKNG